MLVLLIVGVLQLPRTLWRVSLVVWIGLWLAVGLATIIVCLSDRVIATIIGTGKLPLRLFAWMIVPWMIIGRLRL